MKTYVNHLEDAKARGLDEMFEEMAFEFAASLDAWTDAKDGICVSKTECKSCLGLLGKLYAMKATRDLRRETKK